MKERRYFISSCLVGDNCTYKADNHLIDRCKELIDYGFAIKGCPECLGGLPTPRIPSEIIGSKVINKENKDVTFNYNTGARLSLKIAKEFNASYAILKSRSPSCGMDYVYDGTFSKSLKKGNGITTRLFLKNKIKVINEEDVGIYDAIIVAAGNSLRTSLGYNKCFYRYKKTTLIMDTLLPFLSDYKCNKIILVCKENEIDTFKKILSIYKNIIYVIGGSFREESVKNGLEKVTSKYVLVHDGDRPNISHELIDKIINKLVNNNLNNVIPFTRTSINKTDYKVNNKYIQTPQAFDSLLLKHLFLKIKDYKFLRDESSLLPLDGYKVNYIIGDKNNYKITTDEDLELLKK